MDAGTVVGGLLSLQELAQPRGKVGEGALTADVATLGVGVDVGLLHHIHTLLVAQVVEPPRLGVRHQYGVVFLSFEGLDVGLGLLACGGGVVGHGAQVDGFTVAVDVLPIEGGFAKANLQIEVLGHNSAPLGVDCYIVEFGALGTPQSLHSTVDVGLEVDGVGLAIGDFNLAQVVVFEFFFGRVDVVAHRECFGAAG